ncbi:MAG: plasmid pRiA4b ORF-3 family protein, partial [Actinomycetes bacterium]
WEHDVRVESHRTAEAPTCLDGARACPPEDCGGTPGYEHLLDVVADPGHPEHPELMEWLGGPLNPEAFDAADATARMRHRRTGRA